MSQNESNECSAHIAIDQSLSIYLTRVRDKQQSSYISVKKTMLPTYLQTHVWQLFCMCTWKTITFTWPWHQILQNIPSTNMIQEATNNNKQSVFVAILWILVKIWPKKMTFKKCQNWKTVKMKMCVDCIFYFIWKVTETDSLFVSIPLSENNQVFQ